MKIKIGLGSLLVFGVTLAAALVVSIHAGLSKPLESDSEQFRSIAMNLASGQGYRSDATFWPKEPTLQRMPGWPAVVVPFLWVTHNHGADAIMRILCCVLHAGVAVLIFCITRRLTSLQLPSTLAGLIYGLHPAGLSLTSEAASEMLFLALAASSLLLMLWQPRWRWVGVLLAGLACLERANFILWFPAWAGLVLVAAIIWKRDWLTKRHAMFLILYGCLFMIPSGLWMLRNQRVTGHFPVMSTLRGQTFYGGNNSVVANDLMYWGYWIFPNQIPGETALVDLATKQHMSEYDADCYYYQRGMAYVKSHKSTMPRLLLGKLVRAYVPMPWKPLLGSYLVALYRWGIYVTALVGFVLVAARLSLAFHLHMLSFFAVNLIMVLGFWGCYRFAFAFEPFLIPFSGIALAAVSGRLFMRQSLTQSRKDAKGL